MKNELDDAKFLASELEKFDEGLGDTLKQTAGNAATAIGNKIKNALGITGATSETAVKNANDKAAAANENSGNTAALNVANYITKVLQKQNKQAVKAQKAANNAAAKAQ